MPTHRTIAAVLLSNLCEFGPAGHADFGEGLGSEVDRLVQGLSFAEWVEFAKAKTVSGSPAKTLNCKSGNYQCGGACINGKKMCRKESSASVKQQQEWLENHAEESSRSKGKRAENQTPEQNRTQEAPLKNKKQRETIPDEQALFAQKMNQINSASLHSGSLYSATVDGKDYFVKKIPAKSAQVEQMTASFAEDLGLEDHFLPAKAIKHGNSSYIVNPLVETEKLTDEDGLISTDILSVETAQKLATFDLITGTRDRHLGNLLATDGKVIGIDHELSFGNEPGEDFKLTGKEKQYGIDVFSISNNKFYNHARGSLNSDDLGLDKELIQSALGQLESHKAKLQGAGLDVKQYERRLQLLEEVANSDTPTFREFMRRINPEKAKETEEFEALLGSLYEDEE